MKLKIQEGIWLNVSCHLSSDFLSYENTEGKGGGESRVFTKTNIPHERFRRHKNRLLLAILGLSMPTKPQTITISVTISNYKSRYMV